MTTKFRFTKDRLSGIEPQDKRVRYRDEKIDGLVLDVLPSGKKSFRVYKRVKGLSSPVNVTLGQFPDIPIEKARKKAIDTLAEIAEGVNPNDQRRVDAKAKKTLKEVYYDYLANKALADSTIRGYQQVMSCYLEDWQQQPFSSIDEESIKRRHRELTERSPAQADLTMRLIRALFNFAKFEYRATNGNRVFQENPVDILNHLKLWNKVPRRQTRISQANLKPWFDAINDVRNDALPFMRAVCDFAELAMLTGLRKSEFLRLSWLQVDMRNKTFHISKTKNGEPLELPMSDYVYSVFQRRQVETTNDYVFQAENEHGYIREPKKCIAILVEATGIQFTLHDLRRTFTSTAELIRVGTYTLKRLLNHKTQRSDVTAGYTVLTAEELREPAQLIENHILKLAGMKNETEQRSSEVLDVLDGLSREQQKQLLEKLLSKQNGAEKL